MSEHRPDSIDALRECERRYRSLFEHSLAAIALHEVVTDAAGVPVDYVFLEVNHAFEMTTGLAADAVVGRRATDLFPGIEVAGLIETYGQVALTGEPVHFEHYFEPLGRSYEILAFSPAPRQFAATFVDISGHKEAAEELSKLHRAVDASGEVIFLTDREGVFTYVNPEFTRVYGYTATDVVGTCTPRILKSGRLTAEQYEAFWRAILAGQVVRGELVNRTKGGRFIEVENSANPVFDGDRIVGFLGIQRDVTDRKRTEEALRESELHYRLLFANNPLPLWVYDTRTLRFLDVNDAALEKYGYTREEFLSLTIRDIRPESDLPRLEASLTGPRIRFEKPGPAKHRKKDGTLIDVEIVSHDMSSGDTVKRLVLANDITDQKQLEDRYRHAQKMEVVGRLAGGIAHDFNNLLTAILGYSQLAMESLGDHPAVADLREVRRAGEQAKGLTQQLLAFSRRQIVSPRVLDVNQVLHDMEKMLGRLIGEDVRLVLEPQPGIEAVRIDPGQLEQIIMNLAVNARDAMTGGGTLTVRTAQVVLAADHAHDHPRIVEGPYVRIEVADTGCGMSPDVQQHLFEPFFTTKDTGKGTGLGLATVYGIVKQSHGYVFASSTVGVGSTFTVYFPAIAVQPDATQVPSRPARAHAGTETILVVEDNDQLRNLATRVLRRAGYTVLTAAGGDEAVRAARAHAGAIHLLFTDVVMPGLSGHAVFDAIATTRPDLKVLYTSGYTNDALADHGVVDVSHLLLKPYRPAALVERVRESLHAPGDDPERVR